MNIDDELLAPFRAVGRGRATAQDLAALRAAVADERPLADPRGGRLLLAGDWHGNSLWARKTLHLAARQGVSTVLQLGDFGFSTRGETMLDLLSATATALGLTLLALDGDDEDFPFLERFPVQEEGPGAGLRPVRPRLWHLPRGARWTWRGPDGQEYRWLAVGGAVAMDRRLHAVAFDRRRETEMTPRQAMLIATGAASDVVVCHDRPWAAAVALGDHPGYWHHRPLHRAYRHTSRLQAVIDTEKPRHVWHGHLHRRTDVVVEPTTWMPGYEIHGLAAGEMSWDESTVIVGCDGAMLWGNV